jgi:excisionase family DNA binding protein
MPVTLNGHTYYRTAEVFRLIGVSRNTLYRWLQKGVLGSVERRDSRGWRLFTREEVDILDSSINRVTKIDLGITSGAGGGRR